MAFYIIDRYIPGGGVLLRRALFDSWAISYSVGFVSRRRPFSTEAQIGLSYAVEKGLFQLRIPTGGSSRKSRVFRLEELSRKSLTRVF